jgi:glycosyltransferase involved in cell wall biosynthesis
MVGMRRRKQGFPMRVLIASHHRYPSYGVAGSGCHPREFPSGSGGHMQDLLALGLSELGHEVLYLLPRGCDGPFPREIQLVSEPVAEIDICQMTTVPGTFGNLREFATRHGLPSILTCHLDRRRRGEASPAGDNWIFVSRSLARTYEKNRCVLNGVDPAELTFATMKSDFMLFMATAEQAIRKGLDIAIAVSRRSGVRLVVAGTGATYSAIDRIAAACRDAGAEYVGDIRGPAKAELLAAAKALILPTRANEGCPLTLIEALMSGTPVIASRAGGIPEVVAADVGYLCDGEDDYVRAVSRLDEISSERCRQYALEHFHYLRMARDYVREFEIEITNHHAMRSASVAFQSG